MPEIWKDIEGYDGKYLISSCGNVRSFSRWANGRILKGGYCGNPGPYHYVVLIKNHRSDMKQYFIHRLVASHFLSNPEGKAEVNHIDGNTLNNDVSNLEWCTRKENVAHASKMGIYVKAQSNATGKLNPRSRAVIQKTKSGEFVREWESVNQIQRETGYLASSIFNCCNKRKSYHTAYNYVWEYKNGTTDNKDNEKSA